jgi:hypothetical protein
MLAIGAVLAVSGGCSPRSRAASQSATTMPATASPVATEAASPAATVWPTSPPGSADLAACPTASKGTELVDTESAFELLMPANWRRLLPGDPGWVTLFGDHESQTEKWLIDGTLQDFAAPLEPRDDDATVDLLVYVHTHEAGKTPEQLAQDYAAVLIGEINARVTALDRLDLPAGPAARLTAVYPYGGSWDFDLRLVAYVLTDGSRGYYLVFDSRDSSADYYAAKYLCMARSFRYLPAASPSPTE